MRRKMVSGTSILICALLPLSLFGAWIGFNHSVYGEAEVILLSSTPNEATFRVVIPGCELTSVSTSHMVNTPNESFSLLSIPHAYHTGGTGLPCLPAIKQTINAPLEADIRVDVLHTLYTDRSLESIGGHDRILPVLDPVLKIPGEKPVFTIDTRTYEQDAFFPSSLARVENDDIMRGHRLALVEIVPVQYNPATGIVRCYSEIVVKITFAGGNIAKTRQQIHDTYSPVFEDFMKRRILNYETFGVDGVLPLPIHYLIITHNTFQTQVNDLAAWLKKKGFKVKVANQDSIGSWTSSGIETYIDAQSPQPSYLLLVGDVNGGYMPAPTGSASGKVTDLYYAETDGSGYLPDIFHGRLSVETGTHITTVVDKILKYQKANMPSGWFKDCAFLAGNDNYTVSEGTHNYCTSTFMDPHGYTTHKLYEVTYGATTQDVADNVNAGRILTTMSGHGSDDGWYDGPQFIVSNVNQLTNGDRLTIATGHCCLANNFGSTTNPCGGESWIRKANGGAVGYYGSCPSTYWDEDDWLQREWYEAIYADEIYEHGRFTEDGMYDGVYNSSSSMKQYYYEAYHVLGDPSLDLWTEAPMTMTVTHDPIIFPGTVNFSVTVTDGSPLQDALVCCWIPAQTPEVHVAAYTNASGVASLSVSPTTPGDSMYVTVTKHNYIPYEGYVLVTAATGPWVTLGRTIINDSGGNGQVNPGESVDLGAYAKNVGSDPAYSVYGLLFESDPYVALVVDSSWYGTIAPDDSSLSNPYYEFNVAGNCPNGHGISFSFEFHDSNDSIWTSNTGITVYAPVLEYVDVAVTNDGNGNGILDPNESADLVVTLENTGGANAVNITSTLTTSSSYITINDASGNYGTINAGNSGSNAADPYNVFADAGTPTGTVCAFQVEVVSGVYVDTFDFSIVVGKKHYYIWNPDPTPTPGLNCHTILGTLGYSGDYGTSLAADLSMYQAVLVFVGIYSNNYVITDGSAQATALEAFLQAGGGRMYLEGGDVWYYDPQSMGGHDFGPTFGINATADGSGNLAPVAGQSGTFTVGMNFSGYTGENNWIDHISPEGSGFLIFYDTDNAYDCGVANNAGTYRTVGTSFEIGLLTDASPPSTRAALLDSIMKFFGCQVNPGVGETDHDHMGRFEDRLYSAYPNPASGRATITYSIASATDVQVSIVDVCGRQVHVLFAGRCDPGVHSLIWDGCDSRGASVAAGVYFISLTTAEHTGVQKIIRIR